MENLYHGVALLIDINEKDSNELIYEKAGKYMDLSNREIFFKFLESSDKGMANQIGNLIDKIVKSDMGEEGESEFISRLCCWALTTFVVNTLFLLKAEDRMKIATGIYIIDTKIFLKQLLTEK